MSRAIIDQLREYLVPYLSAHGVDMSGQKFNCFSGKHGDSTPSMHIVPSSKGRGFFCFGCLAGGDIFTAAHLIEGLPKEGQDFWKETVAKVAEQVGVDYNPEELSPADKERHQLFAVHEDVAEIVSSSLDRKESSIHAFLANRKWTVETARACGVGCIDNFASYVETMKSLGWSEEFLKKANLLDSMMFGKRNMVFVLRDINGKACGFAARDMDFVDGDKKPKYYNSSESPIYSKSTILFMADQCKDEEGPLWIVEGYADAITMWQAGIKKVCAIGGIYFTGPDEMHKNGNNHLELLIDNDFTNVILCLDGDNPGRTGTDHALTEHFPKAPNILVRVCKLDEVDPDDFVTANGAEALRKLPLVSPFAWKLGTIGPTTEPRQIVEDMIPLILQENNNVIRWEMCKDLSDKTGVPITFISEEVTNRSSMDKTEAKKKVQNITKELQRKLFSVSDPEHAVTIVSDAQSKMIAALDKTSKKMPDYTERVASLRNSMMDDKISPRLSLGKYRQLERALRGFPTDAQFLVLTGFPNVGKTSWLRNLTWEIVRSNPDAHIVFMSIDDPFQKIIQGFVSLYTQIDQEEIIDKVELLKSAPRRDAVWEGFDKMQKMSDSLVVHDSVEGDTILAVERHINTAISKHPNKKIVFILDNFHKLSNVAVDQDSPGVVASACDKIKKLTATYNIPIIANVEVRKTDWMSRASMRDIKGSMSIEFSADMVLIMHQSLHLDKETRMIWNAGGDKPPQPINELEITKNKISGYKGSMYLKFLTSRSRMDEMSEAQAIPLIDAEKKRVSERRKDEYGKRKTGWSQNATSSNEQSTVTEGPGSKDT